MNINTFLLLFIGFIFLGSLAVTGWFFVTRGWTEKLPSGKEKRYGKIFRGWYFFWNRTHRVPQKIYFQDRELFVLVGNLAEAFPEWSFEIKGEAIQLDPKLLTWQKTALLAQIEKELDAIGIFAGGDNFKFYREYPVYVFPEWIRYPLATCATCYSSIYGSIFYWGIISLVKENLFGWATSPVAASVFFWIAFCLTLAVINTALAKKYN